MWWANKKELHGFLTREYGEESIELDWAATLATGLDINLVDE